LTISVDAILMSVTATLFVLIVVAAYVQSRRRLEDDRGPVRLPRNATKLADIRESFTSDPIDDHTADLHRPFSMNESGYNISRTASYRNTNIKYNNDDDGI